MTPIVARRALVIVCAWLPVGARTVTAQADATVRVTVTAQQMPVQGARVRGRTVSVLTDSTGNATLHVGPGQSTITVTKLGFAPDTVAIDLLAGSDTSIAVQLTPTPAALSGIVVMSTRTERRLEDEPLRVEVLAGDDVTEKNEMHPGDLRTLFREMSGMRVQTTSAALGAAAVRTQGLRGRYTMILTDGLPLAGAQATGFSLVQLAPLDLRQAEVIKGAASALYGPSALGGVVNLISRRPDDTSQVVVNQTSAGGTDVLAFVARPLSARTGLTVLADAHRQSDVDPDRDAWSDIGGYERFGLRPRFFYGDSSGVSGLLTTSLFHDRRGGGALPAGAGSFRDSLSTTHGDVGATAAWRVGSWRFAARSAFTREQRARVFGGAPEHELRESAFAEVTGTVSGASNTFVVGAGWQSNTYHDREFSGFDQSQSMPGVFVQHSTSPWPWLSATFNGRCDGSSQTGTICSPRASLLLKPVDAVSVRASAGSGWFAPMNLNEETEVIGFSRLTLPKPLEAERGRSASLDVTLTRGPAQLNATLFQHRVLHPVGLRQLSGDTTGAAHLINAAGALRIEGAELFGVYNREPFVVTALYAATRSRELSPDNGARREVPLTPRREAGIDFAVEEDESGAYAAVEVFYTGRQALEDNPYRKASPPFTTIGLLASKRIGNATPFLNVENITNVRQTDYDPILRPGRAPGGGRAVPAWAPLEGRLVNAGVRVAF